LSEGSDVLGASTANPRKPEACLESLNFASLGLRLASTGVRQWTPTNVVVPKSRGSLSWPGSADVSAGARRLVLGNGLTSCES